MLLSAPIISHKNGVITCLILLEVNRKNIIGSYSTFHYTKTGVVNSKYIRVGGEIKTGAHRS